MRRIHVLSQTLTPNTNKPGHTCDSSRTVQVDRQRPSEKLNVDYAHPYPDLTDITPLIRIV